MFVPCRAIIWTHSAWCKLYPWKPISVKLHSKYNLIHESKVENTVLKRPSFFRLYMWRPTCSISYTGRIIVQLRRYAKNMLMSVNTPTYILNYCKFIENSILQSIDVKKLAVNFNKHHISNDVFDECKYEKFVWNISTCHFEISVHQSAVRHMQNYTCLYNEFTKRGMIELMFIRHSFNIQND